MGKIIVTSNCLTGIIASAFKTIFPEHDTFPSPWPQDEASRASLRESLSHAQAWFTLGAHELAEGLDVITVKLPDFVFDAFHPDLTYARSISTGNLIDMHYTSQIVVWCYANRVEPADAAKLFCGKTYAALGYYDRWQSAETRLRDNWLTAGFTDREFSRFFMAVKREPVFMYSFNHPTRRAAVEYARAVARKFDPQRDMSRRDIVIPDALTVSLWPVYPEVGLELGVRGNYFFRWYDDEFDTPLGFIEYMYRNYTALNVPCEDIATFFTPPNLDSVLKQQLAEA